MKILHFGQKTFSECEYFIPPSVLRGVIIITVISRFLAQNKDLSAELGDQSSDYKSSILLSIWFYLGCIEIMSYSNDCRLNGANMVFFYFPQLFKHTLFDIVKQAAGYFLIFEHVC